MNIKSNNDEIIDCIGKDKLEITQYINGLNKFIINCETPLTLAIQGKWGTGKTSIMKLLQEELEKNNVHTLYFNTWQYSQLNDNLYENFVIYLINHIKTNNKIKPKIDFDKLEKLAIPLFSRFIDTVIPEEKKADLIKEGINQLSTIFSNKLSRIEEIENYKYNFGKLISEILKATDTSRFVFFIDDLDRLPPDQALELLEIIKIFLDVKNCIFILAIDNDVVFEGVRRKYGKDFSKEKGRDFFDKIIQVPFSVPTSNYKIEYMLKEGIDKTITKYLDDALKLTTLCTENNPRTIKRVINLYNLMNTILEYDKKKNSEEYCICLYIIQCIQVTYEELYQFLIDNIDNILEQIKSYNDDTICDDLNCYSELSHYLKRHNLSDTRNFEIRKINDKVINFLTNNKSIHQVFRETLSHSAKSNNITSISVAKIVTSTTTKDNHPEPVDTTVEAFKKSIEFILEHKKDNSSIEKFNKWLTTEKNISKKSYFQQNCLLCNQKYVLGTFSGSEAKIQQTKKLWSACAQDNLCMKWYNSNNELILELPEKK